MSRWVLEHEPQLRMGAFLAVFGLMAVWELLAERKQRSQPRSPRWIANFGLLLLDSLLVRLLFPAAAMGFAVVADNRGWGLFRMEPFDALPSWVIVALSMLLLDLVIYAQHWAFHVVPLFWRFHLVHHSDQDLDASSGLRFHPIEILLSMGIKFLAVVLIGAPALAVLLFEIILNATSIFNHGNVRIPLPLDRVLRLVLVTPDMHRVHHSIERAETNSNYGFNVSWWDRVFRTYRAQPAAGHDAMKLGVESTQTTEPRGPLNLLALPLRPDQNASNDHRDDQ